MESSPSNATKELKSVPAESSTSNGIKEVNL